MDSMRYIDSKIDSMRF